MLGLQLIILDDRVALVAAKRLRQKRVREYVPEEVGLLLLEAVLDLEEVRLALGEDLVLLHAGVDDPKELLDGAAETCVVRFVIRHDFLGETGETPRDEGREIDD